MNRRFPFGAACAALLLCCTPTLYAQESISATNVAGTTLAEVTITGQWFFAYMDENCGETDEFREFRLKRGYLTFKKKLSPHFDVRVTQDISVDKEGDGRGNMELRLKYGYLRWKLPSWFVFTKPTIEGGMVHRPWLDFEQKVNDYRVQGKMFLERFDMLSSADYGLSFMCLLGGSMDQHYQSTVSDQYPGRYGSFAIGIYNGGGYDAIEENNDKLFEGRLSLRPLGQLRQLAGLQLHAIGASGKGNSAEEPDFHVLSGASTWQSPWLRASATMFAGKGNLSGDALGRDGKSMDQTGWSLFAEIMIPGSVNLAFFGRHDCMDNDLAGAWRKDWAERVSLLGASWRFLPHSKLVLDWEQAESLDMDSGSLEDHVMVEAAVEFNF